VLCGQENQVPHLIRIGLIIVGPTRPGLVRPRQCLPGATPTLALAPLRLTLNAPASFVVRRDPRPPAESGQARIAIGAGPTRGCSGRRKGHGPRGSPGAAEPPAVRREWEG
jgi:hypothetical protein